MFSHPSDQQPPNHPQPSKLSCWGLQCFFLFAFIFAHFLFFYAFFCVFYTYILCTFFRIYVTLCLHSPFLQFGPICWEKSLIWRKISKSEKYVKRHNVSTKVVKTNIKGKLYMKLYYVLVFKSFCCIWFLFGSISLFYGIL